MSSPGFLSSLELVPMFTGVDHDVDIFGSGIVAEEDEADFTAGAEAHHVRHLQLGWPQINICLGCKLQGAALLLARDDE
eukprot:1134186-Pelagomonas_calceolata.AAC.2